MFEENAKLQILSVAKNGMFPTENFFFQFLQCFRSKITPNSHVHPYSGGKCCTNDTLWNWNISFIEFLGP